MSLKIAWINEYAAPVGGCESYIHTVASGIRAAPWQAQSVLLFHVRNFVSRSFTEPFGAGVYPLVDLRLQLEALRPDIIYIHRWNNNQQLEPLQSLQIPVMRFYHDHRLFCLREHKYRTLSQATCTKPAGMRCYPCLGFIKRSPGNPAAVSFRRLGSLYKEQALNRHWSAHITGSAYMKKHIEEHGFAAEKIHSLPLFAAEPEAAPETPRRQTHFFFAGQLIRGKGIDILLEAMKRLPEDITLTLAGEGRQGDYFRRRCREAGLEERVDFCGQLPADQMRRHYREAAAVVFPVRSPETFGLVGPEAMRYETPVIASEIGGIPEWLRDGENGISIPSNDPDALAGAMRRMAENPGESRRMGVQAGQDYQARFRPALHIESLMKLITRLVEKSQ